LILLSDDDPRVTVPFGDPRSVDGNEVRVGGDKDSIQSRGRCEDGLIGE
jgi:hypothetical protein